MVAMRSSARRVFAVLTVLGCAGIAAVAAPRMMSVEAQQAPDETTGSVGPMSSHRLSLTDEQRHRIFQGLARFADAGNDDALDVADKVPGGAPLQDLPASVTTDIPLLRGHKFMKLDDRILLVDPASRVVVAMIPRYRLLP
jgi:hypothetical protein